MSNVPIITVPPPPPPPPPNGGNAPVPDDEKLDKQPKRDK